MKQVTFNRAMAPHVAGETRVVPDDVAARLAAEGVIDPDPPAFGVPEKPQPTAKPRTRFGRDRLLGQTYLTKDRPS